MSKKRTSKTKKKKNITNNNQTSMPKKTNYLSLDYTLIDFPETIELVSSNPLNIVKKLVQENLFENSSLNELEKEMANQQAKWNSLSIKERNKMLEENKNDISENSNVLWEKNYFAIKFHKSYFSKAFIRMYKASKERDNIIIKAYTSYRTFVKNWKKFLIKNKGDILETFKNENTSNTVAAYINLFSNAGLGIFAESYLNIVRTFWINGMELDSFLLENIHKVIEYSINKELEIADDFLKLPETMTARNISNKMATPKMESYKFISHNSHLKHTEEDEKSKYKIIRKIYEEYKKMREIYSLISEFKTLVEMTRGENAEIIFRVRNGEIHVDDCHITDEIQENFGDFIRDRIEFVRNFVLFNKNEFIDIFLNGTMDECKKICDWFEVSMDRSIIGGIFLSRDFFDEKDRLAIIESAIKATVTHNTDLLKLKGAKLVNWLVIGSR